MTDSFWLKWIESRSNEREAMIQRLPLIEKKQIDHKLVNMYLEDLFFTGLNKFKADLVKEMNEKKIEEPAKSQVMEIIGL